MWTLALSSIFWTAWMLNLGKCVVIIHCHLQHSLSNIYNINAKFKPLFLALQSSRVALKILYMSTYALIIIGVRHLQGKNYKKFKKQKDYKSTSQKIKKVKPFWLSIFLKPY